MRTENPPSAFKDTLLVCALFCVASGIGAIIRPSALDRYAQGVSFYDTGYYVAIARDGYTAIDFTAFHPLWPLVIRGFASSLGIFATPNLGLTAELLSTFLFFAAIGCFLPVLRRVAGRRAALLAAILFALNPHSIFHVLGYSESLTSLLLIGLLAEWTRADGPRLSVLFIFCFLCGLARPLLVFFPVASFAAWITPRLLRMENDKARWQVPATVTLGSVCGYCVYGTYTLSAFGEFFASFHAQEIWGRKFGFYPSLLFQPSSVGGSAQVLYWDLLAFYLPAVWMVWSLRSAVQQRSHALTSNDSIFSQETYWFCLYLTCGLSLSALFSYPIFASTGRHVFGIPPLFFAAALVLSKHQPKVLWAAVMVVVSVLFYWRWWARFAVNSWIG